VPDVSRWVEEALVGAVIVEVAPAYDHAEITSVATWMLKMEESGSAMLIAHVTRMMAPRRPVDHVCEVAQRRCFRIGPGLRGGRLRRHARTSCSGAVPQSAVTHAPRRGVVCALRTARSGGER
jgi:hypothetical protein